MHRHPHSVMYQNHMGKGKGKLLTLSLKISIIGAGVFCVIKSNNKALNDVLVCPKIPLCMQVIGFEIYLTIW